LPIEGEEEEASVVEMEGDMSVPIFHSHGFVAALIIGSLVVGC